MLREFFPLFAFWVGLFRGEVCAGMMKCDADMSDFWEL